MGAFTSRQNAAVEEAEQISNNAYKYPPRSGNFFGSHFIMGGERFDTPQPESYLFGENSDLNFLGNRPTSFPYPPPQANEPTKTLKNLINIRKESVRFVRVPHEKHETDSVITITGGGGGQEHVDGNILCIGNGSAGDANIPVPCSYNIEFIFDSDVKCAITIYYFCTEEVSPSGVTLVPRDGLTSETYHYGKGINQLFSQPGHIFNPQLIPEDDLIYNTTKEQYPVAIHCVVEEGNEECRQSHTTICVIDHHPESNSYVLRALKQKIFVDGLCYLLQEIYGIENKAVNKGSIDEEIDDHGSECVICMSETRDTLILPCRHLCLCNSCADSLRYQANNCPICRAPFRALLQIRAVQKGISSHVLHQNTPTSGAGEPATCDQHVPAGYIPVSLIEALNGPPQYIVSRSRINEELSESVAHIGTGTNTTENHKATSPLKPSNQRRQKIKKNASTCTSTNEVGTITNSNPSFSIVEIDNEDEIDKSIEIDSTITKTTITTAKTTQQSQQKKSPNPEKIEKVNRSTSQEKFQIINERQNLKLPKNKRNSNANVSANNSQSSQNDVDDVDSENEKLSPLLAPGNKCKSTGSGIQMNNTTLNNDNNDSDDHEIVDDDDNDDDNDNGDDDDDDDDDADNKIHIKNSSNAHKRIVVVNAASDVDTDMNAESAINAEDSDYYTPEDTQNSLLSPLCPEKLKMTDKLSSLSNLKSNSSGSFRNNGGSVIGIGSGLVKKNLHKKSTSVGNIVGPATTSSGVDLKGGNVSSLPDMLDSPISGNSTSTRSSSDSYSSSSSTKQLLSSNPTTAAANIIVDDKTALQNAVNV